MSEKKTLAAIQMASGPNLNANLLEAERLIADAVRAGAQLVVLPENFVLMGMKESDKLAVAEPAGEGPMQTFLQEQAHKHGIWIAGGSIFLRTQDPNRVRASCLVFNDQGEQVARYDKRHLFDVTLEESGETYHESATIEPGDEVVVVDSPFGRLGVAICYDLRFPEQFRELIDHQMEVLLLPAAFTANTGQAHWEVLIRARAIENLCYVVAAAQGGYHANGRATHGDSMIVDPWGHVLDRLPRGSGFVAAKLDLEHLRGLRRSFPALEHRRLYCRAS